MSFSPPVQLFFISIIFGAVVGVFWDLNRVLKKNISHKENYRKITFVLDVCFCVFATIVTMNFFFNFTYSGFRGFVLVGELIGLLIYFCTITKHISFFLRIIIGFVLKIFLTIFSFFGNLVSKIIINITKLLSVIKIKTKKIKRQKIKK